MNKKVLIACLLAFVLLIIAVIVGLSIKKKKATQVFVESDYPFTYEVQKDNTLKITLDGKKTKDLSWSYEIENEEYIAVTQKGKEHSGKATFIVSPRAAGLTNIKFKRSTDLAGYPYDAAVINAPIYVTETNAGLSISFLENPWLALGPEPVAEDTEFPFLISYNDQSNVELLFINGISDWEITDPNNMIGYMDSMGENNMDHCMLYKIVPSSATSTDAEADADANADSDYDPTAGLILDTTLTVSSASMGVTEYIDVNIDVDGNMTAKKGEAPK